MKKINKMKNNKLKNRVIMLFAFLLATSTSFAQISTEENMAKAIFETIKNNDLETFTSYCASKERISNMLDGMEETTPKEKAIKQDLKDEDPEFFINQPINKYKLLIDELKKENLTTGKAEFKEVFLNEIRFEITNCKASKLKFKASFGTIEYRIILNIIKTKDDIFIYDFQSDKIEPIENK